MCTKYYPIHIGGGEANICQDMDEGDNSIDLFSTTSDKRLKKRTADAAESAIGLQDIMKSITTMCDTNKNTCDK